MTTTGSVRIMQGSYRISTPDPKTRRGLLKLFSATKTRLYLRPILDPKSLNQFIKTKKFKMTRLQQVILLMGKESTWQL